MMIVVFVERFYNLQYYYYLFSASSTRKQLSVAENWYLHRQFLMEYKLISKVLLVLRIRFLCLPNSLPNPIQQTFQLIYIIHFALPQDFGCYQSRSQSLTYYFQSHAESTVPKNYNNWSYPNHFVSKTIVLFEVVFLGLMTIYIHVSNWLNIYDIMFV